MGPKESGKYRLKEQPIMPYNSNSIEHSVLAIEHSVLAMATQASTYMDTARSYA
jgi:hypothetical protein